MNRNFNYNTNFKEFAREHRNSGTKAEIRLWCELLRNKKMMGYSFLRQRPIGQYIVDFFCKELMLAIETDGYSHNLEETFLKDNIKEKYLKKLGVFVMRFTDNKVMKDIENVKQTLEDWIKNHPPTPFKGGQKGTEKSINEIIKD